MMMNDTQKRVAQFSTQIDKAFSSGADRHVISWDLEVQRDRNRVFMTIEKYGDVVVCPNGQDFDEWLGNSARFARKFKEFAVMVAGKPDAIKMAWDRWEANQVAAK